ncbi:MAG: gamma-glutamylcyclotransferase, partial [Acidobacteria bacterium]|nr:gamma-glutamylcyclotransferase [Acidobacteriota bacterium]
MTDLVFFYGTLMSGFERPGRSGIDSQLAPIGRGWIPAALFDLGIYPAAVPASDSRVWGELHRMRDVSAVLSALDEIEGYRAEEPDTSLYHRVETPVTLKNFLHFYVPLAMTSLLVLLVQPIGSAALSRMPNALPSLAVWPVLAGLVFLVRSMGLA